MENIELMSLFVEEWFLGFFDHALYFDWFSGVECLVFFVSTIMFQWTSDMIQSWPISSCLYHWSTTLLLSLHVFTWTDLQTPRSHKFLFSNHILILPLMISPFRYPPFGFRGLATILCKIRIFSRPNESTGPGKTASERRGEVMSLAGLPFLYLLLTPFYFTPCDMSRSFHWWWAMSLESTEAFTSLLFFLIITHFDSPARHDTPCCRRRRPIEIPCCWNARWARAVLRFPPCIIWGREENQNNLLHTRRNKTPLLTFFYCIYLFETGTRIVYVGFWLFIFYIHILESALDWIGSTALPLGVGKLGGLWWAWRFVWRFGTREWSVVC